MKKTLKILTELKDQNVLESIKKMITKAREAYQVGNNRWYKLTDGPQSGYNYILF